MARTWRGKSVSVERYPGLFPGGLQRLRPLKMLVGQASQVVWSYVARELHCSTEAASGW